MTDNVQKSRLGFYGKTFLNALYSGLFIGIAGTVFLATPNKTAGAIFFAFALLSIICYGFKLFTGAVGYLAVQEKKEFFPHPLWIKSRCGSKEKSGFPHKNALRLLLLPK